MWGVGGKFRGALLGSGGSIGRTLNELSRREQDDGQARDNLTRSYMRGNY